MHRLRGTFNLLTRYIQFAFLSDAIHMAREHRQNAIQCLNITVYRDYRSHAVLWLCFLISWFSDFLASRDKYVRGANVIALRQRPSRRVMHEQKL